MAAEEKRIEAAAEIKIPATVARGLEAVLRQFVETLTLAARESTCSEVAYGQHWSHCRPTNVAAAAGESQAS